MSPSTRSSTPSLALLPRHRLPSTRHAACLTSPAALDHARSSCVSLPRSQAAPVPFFSNACHCCTTSVPPSLLAVLICAISPVYHQQIARSFATIICAAGYSCASSSNDAPARLRERVRHTCACAKKSRRSPAQTSCTVASAIPPSHFSIYFAGITATQYNPGHFTVHALLHALQPVQAPQLSAPARRRAHWMVREKRLPRSAQKAQRTWKGGGDRADAN